MKPSPAFPFYASDFLSSADVLTMSLEQVGAFVILLCTAWLADDCGLPDNDDDLAILSRMNEGWLKGGSKKVRKKFFSKDGRLYNVKLLEIKEEQKNWKLKCSAAGKLSVKARKARKLRDVKDGSKGSLKVGTDLVEDYFEGPTNSLSLSSIDVNPSDSLTPIVPKPTPKKTSKEKYLERFDKFWDVYPLKVGKGKARDSWLKLKPSDKLTDAIIEAVQIQKKSNRWQKQEGSFIPMPATWLNQTRWEDNLKVEVPKPDGQYTRDGEELF